MQRTPSSARILSAACSADGACDAGKTHGRRTEDGKDGRKILMIKHPVGRLLEEGALLFDGATGTYAASIPGFPEGAVEAACLTAPDQVRHLHEAYLSAGCHAVKTNTFAAHVGAAAEDEQAQRAIIQAACRIAEEAAAPHGAYVFADIGPAPLGANAACAYCRMADAFLEAGASCFLFETLSSLDGVCEAAAYIKCAQPDAFVVVSVAANPDGYTSAGEEASALIARAAAQESIDAVGLNCGCGAYHMRRLLERFASVTQMSFTCIPLCCMRMAVSTVREESLPVMSIHPPVRCMRWSIRESTCS